MKLFLFLTFCVFSFVNVSFSNDTLSTDEYIIKLKNDSSSLNRIQMVNTKTISNLKNVWRELGLFKTKINSPEELQKLKDDSNVEYIEPNYEVHALKIPNDTDYSKLWNMFNSTSGIDAEAAWDISTGSSDIVVGVVDTGIDYKHKELSANMWINEGETGLDANGNDKRFNGIDDDGDGFIDDVYGYDFVNNDGDPLDDHKHGTHCAGVIGAKGNNNNGIAGVNWNVKLMALKFLDLNGSGKLDAAIKAIKFGVDHGARVLSNSWGGGGFSQALLDSIKYAESKNVVFVAAAGNASNDNDADPTYPATYKVDNIISVAAIDVNAKVASFSNFGLTNVHVAAPGVSIYSSIPNDGYVSMSGTSMACPHVSGIAALMLSKNPNLTPLEIKNVLIETSVHNSNLTNVSQSQGRVSAKKALDYISDTNFAVAPTEVKIVKGDSFALSALNAKGKVKFESVNTKIADTSDNEILAKDIGKVDVKVYDGTGAVKIVKVEVIPQSNSNNNTPPSGCTKNNSSQEVEPLEAGTNVLIFLLPLFVVCILRRKR